VSGAAVAAPAVHDYRLLGAIAFAEEWKNRAAQQVRLRKVKIGYGRHTNIVVAEMPCVLRVKARSVGGELRAIEQAANAGNALPAHEACPYRDVVWR
jgi:hypothetical protein